MVALCPKLRTSALADSLLRVSCIIFSSLAQSPPLSPFLPFAASRRAQFQFWAKVFALELLQVSDSSICSETSDLATPIIQEVLFQLYCSSFGSALYCTVIFTSNSPMPKVPKSLALIISGYEYGCFALIYEVK